MDPALERVFLDFCASKLTQLASRIQDCLRRLSPEQIWARSNDNQNAAGNLVLHLCGNVRQWIISGIGGAPDVRQRDREFSARGGPEAHELTRRLKATVEEAVAVLNSLPLERLAARVRIQAYELTVLEAILHVVEHFAQHAGQVLYFTKLATGQDLGYYKHLSAGTAPPPTSEPRP
jgi:uncharacterized damage-inducible protein DinB